VLGDIQQFVGIAQTVEVTATAFEASGNADGKIKAISLGISQTLLSTPFLTGHKIQNTAAFQQACNLYAQATQQLLASLHPNGVVVSDKTAK
jgi:hypothetical protein